MKRLLCIVLALTMLIGLAACAPRTAAPEPTPTPTPAQGGEATPTPTPDQAAPLPGQGKLKDGTYDAKGDKWQYGDESATVVIENDRIKSIILRRLTLDGQEVNYDEWIGEEFQGAIRPNLKQFREEMASRMIEKQSYNVDAIAGATVTCENWMLAVSRALQQAAQQ